MASSIITITALVGFVSAAYAIDLSPIHGDINNAKPPPWLRPSSPSQHSSALFQLLTQSTFLQSMETSTMPNHHHGFVHHHHHSTRRLCFSCLRNRPFSNPWRHQESQTTTMASSIITITALVGFVSAAYAIDLSPIHGDINNAMNAAIDDFVSKIHTVSIPNVEGKDGSVRYYLWDNRVKSMSRGSANIDIRNEGLVTLSLDGFGISAEGSWRVKYRKKIIKISDSGRFDATGNG